EITPRDTEEQAVAELTGHAGDGHANGLLHEGGSYPCAATSDEANSSRIVRASVSSAMRAAAAAAAPPLSGCASRNMRRNRRFTSSRSTVMPARKPSTSIAHR